MDFQLKSKKDSLVLSSGRLLNAAFILPSAVGAWYLATNSPVTLWSVVLALAFFAGLTYRERWVFRAETASFRFSLFLIPLQRKSIGRKELAAVQLKTFIRGQNRPVEPGSDRKWYRKEQGLLKLLREDGTEDLLLMDTNRKTIRLREGGEEIAAFLKIPFLINENGPA